ncbi:MAG: hypothetical protein OXI96_03185 [Acidimicrobiaceae bacterium]|nr:hypothetical protein [Acidimicrobiaceae bacterium]
MSQSRHDRERDRIAADWSSNPSFICDGCELEYKFPRNLTITTESRYAAGSRADVVATGTDGRVVGVVEVVDTHRPTPRALAEQNKLDFAFYRLLSLPSPPKKRSIDDEISKGQFCYPDARQRKHDGTAWLCSGTA